MTGSPRPNYKTNLERREQARQALRDAVVADVAARVAASGPDANHDEIAWAVIDNERVALTSFLSDLYGDVVDAVPTVGNVVPVTSPEFAERMRAEVARMNADLDDLIGKGTGT